MNVKAIVAPDELEVGFDIGWLFDCDEPYAVMWGNSKTRELATKVLRDNYPTIEIVQSPAVLKQYKPGSQIKIVPKELCKC